MAGIIFYHVIKITWDESHQTYTLNQIQGGVMKIARMNPYEGSSKTVAFFDIETSEDIIVKGFTLVDGPKGLFISAPSDKGKDDKYYEKVILPHELKNQLSDMAIEKYHQLKGEEV